MSPNFKDTRTGISESPLLDSCLQTAAETKIASTLISFDSKHPPETTETESEHYININNYNYDQTIATNVASTVDMEGGMTSAQNTNDFQNAGQTLKAMSLARTFMDSTDAVSNPDYYFTGFKRTIKLNSRKHYVEDTERTAAELNKPYEETIEIKDKYGRVMEHKSPLMQAKKRQPNASRRPKKRPPLLRKRSFVADQYLNHDIEERYDPIKAIT